MSHNYDDLVVITNGASDYWRLDTQVDELVNKAKVGMTTDSFPYTNPGSTTHNLLPAANNLHSNYFDGSANYGLAVTSQYQNYTYRLSVEAWVRPSSDQSATDFIGLVNKSGSFGLCLNYGKPAFYTILNGGDGSKRIAASSTALSTDTNYHLVGTYDGSAEGPARTRIYVNGSLATEVDSTSGEMVQNSSGLAIGSWDTSVLFFNGYISNVALYAYELTSGQVSADYGYSG